MAHILCRSRAFSRILSHHVLAGSLPKRKHYHVLVVSSLHRISTARHGNMKIRDPVRRLSKLSEAQHASDLAVDVLSFIKSTFTEVEGSSHRWLNKMHDDKVVFSKNGSFLVLVNACMPEPTLFEYQGCAAMFERVKFLQQRYPKLNVFGLQYVASLNSIDVHCRIVQTIMENYVTFPILLSNKDFNKMLNGACYLLFEGSTHCLLQHKSDVELAIISQSIKELSKNHKDEAVIRNWNGGRTPQQDDSKEPYSYASLRSLFLCYPGCISVDEEFDRLFISDCNHHRIIIADRDMKIVDCIGSLAGFEDGEFESAKLWRPAASFFDSADNSLYIVDSENHAIRRADLERRVLETVHPIPVKKANRIWRWILDKLGLKRESDLKNDVDASDQLAFPWHLMKLEGDDLLIVNRSFEMSWIMSVRTWEIRKVIGGSKTIEEMFGNKMSEQLSPFKDIYCNSLQQWVDCHLSYVDIPYRTLMSSIANFNDYTVFCDAAGQRVLKYHRGSRCVEYVQFSDLGILGLPYWLVCPLEKFFRSGNSSTQWKEHLHRFNILPGKCDIRVNINIPRGTELAATFDERCIWRQARGSAAELSKSDGTANSTEKVGIAQQWFDELDNLAFTNPEMELDPNTENKFEDKCIPDSNKVHFDCAVNVSPGTSEVVVSAALYLKLTKAQDAGEEYSEALRILGLENRHRRQPEEEACVKLLLDTCGDLRDTVFTKPLHLRIKLDCADHPTADTHKETISTQTSLEIDVSLD